MVFQLTLNGRRTAMMVPAKNGKKAIGNCAIVFIFFVMTCFIAPLTQSQDAYAGTKKVSGTYKNLIRLTSTQIPIANSNLHVYHVLLSSSDPDWNNARFFYVEYTEIATDYNKKGYGTITHPNGDQTFIEFVDKEKAIEGVYSGKINGSFMGGTGKFKSIGAYWRVKWKYDAMGAGFFAEWEVVPY
jgi:cold shock CspA family protein